MTFDKWLDNYGRKMRAGGSVTLYEFAQAAWEARESEISSLREECEKLRMQLAGCGVAAMANTASTAAARITKDNPYWSASYSDVCAAVDREMALREENEKLREFLRQRDKTAAKDQEEIEGLRGVNVALKEAWSSASADRDLLRSHLPKEGV